MVGGGLAGVAAATRLVEEGVAVTLVERQDALGGRLGGWMDRLRDGTLFSMDRGFFAVSREARNTRSLLGRVDPGLGGLSTVAGYAMLGPGGAVRSLERLPRRAPFNVLELLRRAPSIRLRDLARADLRKATRLFAFDPEETHRALAGTSAKDLLTSIGLPEGAGRALFGVLASASFNPIDRYCAAELVGNIDFLLGGQSDGLVMDAPSGPPGAALWPALERHLQAHGADVRRRADVLEVERNGIGWNVRVRARGVASVVKADAVVLAAHIPGLKRIAGASPSLGPVAASVASLEVSLAQVVWRLWLDRPVAEERPAYGAAAGMGMLDAVVLLDRIGTRSEHRAARSRRAVVELHAYAVPESMPEAAIRRDLLAQLHAAYPETRSATVVDERFLLKQESPAFRPGSHASRPTVTTAVDGIYLAGDHVKLPFFAAPMERATASGFLAANTILAGWGKRTQPVEKRAKRRGIF